MNIKSENIFNKKSDEKMKRTTEIYTHVTFHYFRAKDKSI